MAIIPVDIKIELVKEQMKTQARKKIETAWRSAAETHLRRKLSVQEEAMLIEKVNKLFFGREEWLKQMREAEVRLRALIPAQTYTEVEETALNTTVNGLLETNPDFINGYKYEADAASENKKSEANGPDNAIKGIFSKITGALGNGPFAFIGKLLEKIFSMIFSFMPAFKEMGEKLNPKKTVVELMNEGKLEDANVLLKKQEAELLTKMDSALVEMATNPHDQKHARRLLRNYREHLNKLENDEFLGKATDQYLRDNLNCRNELFKEYSSKADELLSAHAKKVAMDKKIATGNQEVLDLTNKHAAIINDTPEKRMLANRLLGLQTELLQLNPQQLAFTNSENQLLHDFPTQVKAKVIPIMGAHEVRFTKEFIRQSKL